MSSCCSLNVPASSNTRQRCMAFSEDGRFFAVGTTDGFIVYCTEPFVPMTVREVKNGGVSLISMFARSNLLLLVSPKNPKTVLLWNEALSPPAVCAEASFHSDIMAVRLHQAMILIADSNGVHIFNQKMECSHSFQYNAASRSIGLNALSIAGSAVCSISSEQHQQLLSIAAATRENNTNSSSTNTSANSLPSLLLQQQQDHQDQKHQGDFIFPIAIPCPHTIGHILFVLLDARNPEKLKAVHRRSVPVHNKPVAITTFSQNGKFVASCSTGGTALKLTHVQTGNVLMQFNRGTTPNQIHSLAFAGLSYLACVSGTGSVHLFAIVDKVQKMLQKIDDEGDGDEEDNNITRNTTGGSRRNNNNTESSNNSLDEGFDDLSGDTIPSAAEAAARVQNRTSGGGVLGFFKTMMQTTTDFHEGVWSCGHFDLLQLHPSASKRALFGPAICSFLSEGMTDDDGSLKFLVAHGESGKIGKVSFFPNDSVSEKKQVQEKGAAVVQSQNAAMLQVPMGKCSLVTSWIFPTDAF